MLRITWKLLLPLTIILFSIFTKWWYVLPVDAPDTMMIGFPLISISPGWHSSLSLQIFVVEYIFNFLFYFLSLFCVAFTIKHIKKDIKIPKPVSIVLYLISGLFIVLTVFIGFMPDNIYKFKRDIDVEVLTTGYRFIWQTEERPNYKDYKPLKE